MSQLPSLPLDSRHVNLQFTRRSPLDAAQFLYGEVAQRMLQRLSYIRISPSDILDAGCGAGHALEPLRFRFPQARYIGLDANTALLDVARQRYAAKPGFWQKLRNKPTPETRFLLADMADAKLPPESLDLVWSNMALHWHPEPHLVLAEWRRILRPGALAMFSCLGPGSMPEIRQAIATADLQTVGPAFADMHDLGDLLVESGFSDPVMDQELLTLTYRTPEKLLDDLRILGGNPHTARRRTLPGRQWRTRLLAALESQRQMDGTIHLTLELAYGHAWRSASMRKAPGETRVSIAAIGRRSKNDGVS